MEDRTIYEQVKKQVWDIHVAITKLKETNAFSLSGALQALYEQSHVLQKLLERNEKERTIFILVHEHDMGTDIFPFSSFANAQAKSLKLMEAHSNMIAIDTKIEDIKLWSQATNSEENMYIVPRVLKA